MRRASGGGRKPLPTATKAAIKYRADRTNQNEPSFPVSNVIPEPPALLDDFGKDEWRRIIKVVYNSGVATDLDLTTVAAYCSAYGDWAELEQGMRDGTYTKTVLTKHGVETVSPQWRMLRDARQQMVRFAGELGLTPVARSRVTANPTEQQEDDIFA